ncbi:hypothetical protein [Deinococcus gobiensis]|uniref:Uncharacterized protein n=1 Tax=Deinococcus gobiensis (strain DSM 21396 / JCM 16679 / CGMCC 1.7299 / I-0) TaxID=745776 RepID=H8H1Q0_DEIGI|nr:hypothetical protein [Deinococcus gobiensis]AFD27447.1 hypothetical protein DGo_PB0178 [Deinococcus gobiensis I-0]
MNVLYVSGAGDQATLLHAGKTESAPLGTLKALAARMKAKGNTILVVDASLQATEVPAGLSTPNMLLLLDSKHGKYAVPSAEAAPSLVQLVDPALLSNIRNAAKSAGLRLTYLVPFSSAVLRSVEADQSLLIVHQTMTTYEITSLSTGDPLTSRSTTKTERTTLDQTIATATKKARGRGDQPKVIVVGDEPLAFPSEDVSVRVLELQDVLQNATKPFPLPAEPSTFAGPTVASMTRNLNARAPLDKRLLAGLALAAVVNGGLYVATTVVGGQVQALTATRDSLTMQAAEVDALQAANQKLAASNEQARTIIGNKGPLAQDLPLLVGRITELPATLSSLSGPNNATADDARAFGDTVQRTYDLSATTTRVEDLTRAYQERGLRADVRNIDCSTPRCTVTFRAAPVPLATTPTNSTTTTGGATSTPTPVTP